jgi:cytochrome P450
MGNNITRESSKNYLDAFRQDPLQLLTKLSNREEAFVSFTLGGEQCRFVNDPVAIEKILSTHHENFSKVFGFQRARVLIGKGLFTRELNWKNLNISRIDSKKYNDCVDQQCRSWDVGEINVFEEMKEISLRIMATTICEGSLDADLTEIKNAVEFTIDCLNQITLPFPEIILELPEEYKNKFSLVFSFLQKTVNSKDNSPQNLDKVMTSLLAGYEQIGSVLAWALFLLAQYPDIQGLAKDKIHSTLERREPTIQDCRLLPLITGIIEETLRIYPPVWMLARRTLDDFYFNETFIKRNTIIVMSQYTTHRKSLYFDNPLEFKPARWQKKDNLPMFAFFPFGHGPRVCKGENFVRVACTVVLIRLLQFYKFELHDYTSNILEPRITLRPKNGLSLKVSV